MATQSNQVVRRIAHAVSVVARRVVAVLMIVGGSLNGSRSGDQQARALYERRNRDYRP